MKTSKKDYELFKSECQRWIDKLGLTEWSMNFRFRDLNSPTIGAKTQTEEEEAREAFRKLSLQFPPTNPKQ